MLSEHRFDVDIDALLEHIMSVKDSETLKNEKDQIIKEFYILYNEAYKELANGNPNISSHDEAFSIESQTHRYVIFKSFIRNCLIARNMWGRIGTGKIRFTPYQALYDYFYDGANGFTRGKVLESYINMEIPKEEIHKK